VAAPIGRVSRWRIGVFEVSLSRMDRRAFLASMGWGGAWFAASDLDAAERRAVSQSASVLIVGGGVGGVAAALAACRAGLRVVLTEETLWIGGAPR
jgi:alkyl hydroperoxide reductase subunit AhpF